MISKSKKCMENIMVLLAKELGSDYIVEQANGTKNNGGIRYRISITDKNSDDSTQTFLVVDHFLEKISAGNMSLDEAVKEMVQNYLYRDSDKKGISVPQSKDEVLQKVVYSVINYDMNRVCLKEIPHKNILDLAAVYKCVVSATKDCRTSFLVQNSDMENLNITLEELDEAAYKNTLAEGFAIFSMSEFFESMGVPKEVIDEDHLHLYALRSNGGFDGASIILYQDQIKALADQLDSDLFLLPSSIHELLALPATEGVEPEKMLDIVRDVNQSDVIKPEEVLSYSIYGYYRETNIIGIVAQQGWQPWPGIEILAENEVRNLWEKGGLKGSLMLYPDGSDSYMEEDYEWAEIERHLLCGGSFGREISA